ncbi:MAG TPA: MmgE/PrpD family protein [Hyphomicrobiales bacterium]|nr:MmgE/PrpD family protein [Hyphomicrobiales bacterium]
MGLTQDIGRFAAGLGFADLPRSAIDTATQGFTDCVGVMLAGSTETAAETAARLVGLAALPLIGPPAGTTAEARALAYGTAAHVLDYDDTGLSGHPSAVLVPAILAVAEESRADGAAMLAAYVAGYETWAELWAREPDQLHAKGWHPTAVYGTVAAAAAAASLRRLDPAQATAALGIAASRAAGVVANFGSMTKSFQVGTAARAGVEAARAAALGMTASPDALEHRAGLLRALSPRDRVDTQSPAKIGGDWAILRQGLNIKRYPVCYALHRALDGMLALRDRIAGPDAIAAVTVELGETQAGMLRTAQPQTALDAKFSAPFAMAAAAIAGRCGLAELSDGFVRRPDVQAFLPRVAVQPLAGRDDEEPTFSPYDRVSLRLASGETMSGEPVRRPRGHFANPLAPANIAAKFLDCAATVLGPPEAQRLLAALLDLEHLASFEPLRIAPTRQRKAS